jgi:hypothetical protein
MDGDGACFSVCIDCTAEWEGKLMSLWLGVPPLKDTSCRFCKKLNLDKEYDGYWHESRENVSICLDCRPFPLRSNLKAALIKADEVKEKKDADDKAEKERKRKATTIEDKDRVTKVTGIEKVFVEWSISDPVCDVGHALTVAKDEDADCMICCERKAGDFL